MSEIDYEELIRSPLDDLEGRSSNGWALAVAGLGLGLVLGSLLAVGLNRGESEPLATTTSTSTTTTTTTVGSSGAAADYPPGFTEIGPGLAANVTEVILGEELVTIAFTAAVQRGDDPVAANWPVGGTWLLESGSGAIAESSRVVVGRYSPGAFSVQFPAAPFNGETEFVTTRIVERWDVETFTGSEEIPFDGEPFTASETLSIPVNQEVTLIVPALKLGRFLGSVEWQTAGAELGTTVHLVATLVDVDGGVVGSYERFPEILEPGDHGVMEIYWSEPFPTGQEGAVTASLGYTVGVVRTVPVSIDFDLGDVPVGR